MLLKPLPHIGVLVCPVVVQNQVQGQSLWRFPVDLAQELQELLVSMTRVTGADHGAVEHVERREQTGGSSAIPVASDPTLVPAISHPRRAPALCPVG